MDQTSRSFMEQTGGIFVTQDGSHSIFSAEHGVSYHSKYGAIQETRHVFIEAGLYYKSLNQKELSILEIGFGTGLNAYMSLIASHEHGLKLHYEAIEAFPISVAQAQALNYPQELPHASASPEFLALHESPWGEPVQLSTPFSFLKHHQKFEEIEYQEQFDLLYFDAFAPNAQPELWEPPLLSKMYDALKPGGAFVTYCAKGVVKRNLKSLGFTVESLPGPPGKREMTRGIK